MYVAALIENGKDLATEKALELLVDSAYLPRIGETISLTRGAESIERCDGGERNEYQTNYEVIMVQYQNSD